MDREVGTQGGSPDGKAAAVGKQQADLGRQGLVGKGEGCELYSPPAVSPAHFCICSLPHPRITHQPGPRGIKVCILFTDTQKNGIGEKIFF